MKSIAVFMGAGASKPFGFPITSELLPLIKERLDSKRLFAGSQDIREELSRYLSVLLPGFNSVSTEDLPLITDVLSLIDLSLLVGNSPAPFMNTKELTRFRILLERAILKVLDVNFLTGQVPDPLYRLSNWVSKQAEVDDQSIGIISTNYDIALETQLFRRSPYEEIKTEFDFGFSWRDIESGRVHIRPPKPSYHLYKLHGSLNWLRCDLCEHIYINPSGAIADLGFVDDVGTYNTCHCGHAPLRSVIVAPSLVRDIRDVNLLEIWKNALELLRTASEWIIIGYSFPSEDIAIRSLFLRAYNGRISPPLIRVIQKESDRSISSRYKLLFPDSNYESGGLEKFLLALDHQGHA